MEELKPEELADQIMRWDWRDMFREGNKKAIREMFEAYGEQVKLSVNKPICDYPNGFDHWGYRKNDSYCGICNETFNKQIKKKERKQRVDRYSTDCT
jgi:hypothetical protein